MKKRYTTPELEVIQIVEKAVLMVGSPVGSAVIDEDAESDALSHDYDW